MQFIWGIHIRWVLNFRWCITVVEKRTRVHMPEERKESAGVLPLIQGNGVFVLAIPKVVQMAFLRDFLIAKEGISKEVGVLPYPANNVVQNYRMRKYVFFLYPKFKSSVF